jgi:hypothetical protein
MEQGSLALFVPGTAQDSTVMAVTFDNSSYGYTSVAIWDKIPNDFVTASDHGRRAA